MNEMERALIADGEKLLALTGKDHGPWKFAEVFCSSCGCGFGPGDHGFSHCEHHAHLRQTSN